MHYKIHPDNGGKKKKIGNPGEGRKNLNLVSHVPVRVKRTKDKEFEV